MNGDDKDITWTFTKAGTTLYGCHEPGHYVAGMKGTITVTQKGARQRARPATCSGWLAAT